MCAGVGGVALSAKMTIFNSQNGSFVVARENDSISSIWVLGNIPHMHAEHPSIYLSELVANVIYTRLLSSTYTIVPEFEVSMAN